MIVLGSIQTMARTHYLAGTVKKQIFTATLFNAKGGIASFLLIKIAAEK